MHYKNTHIIIVLDQSSSMQPQRGEVISGFNAYLDSIKDGHTTVTLVKFPTPTSEVEVVYGNVPLKDVPRLDTQTYTPMSTTPLFDAIMRGIGIGENIKRRNVLFVVFTDGEENTSKEFHGKLDVVKAAIEAKQAAGWAMVYLGVAPAAFDGGASMGFDLSNVGNSVSVAKGIQGLVGATMSYYRTGNNTGLVDPN